MSDKSFMVIYHGMSPIVLYVNYLSCYVSGCVVCKLFSMLCLWLCSIYVNYLPQVDIYTLKSYLFFWHFFCRDAIYNGWWFSLSRLLSLLFSLTTLLFGRLQDASHTFTICLNTLHSACKKFFSKYYTIQIY